MGGAPLCRRAAQRPTVHLAARTGRLPRHHPATLENIAAKAAARGVGAPATLVVGRVVHAVRGEEASTPMLGETIDKVAIATAAKDAQHYERVAEQQRRTKKLVQRSNGLSVEDDDECSNTSCTSSASSDDTPSTTANLDTPQIVNAAATSTNARFGVVDIDDGLLSADEELFRAELGALERFYTVEGGAPLSSNSAALSDSGSEEIEVEQDEDYANYSYW